ncbi:SMI1/KNR4 family protein [Salininema proteolyticum]|uniref:SMI1/KNR4 family protein n=1 Tax=Salininema proteolyticum TaxID=1607685 RepID=A0ABV8TX66_9ACTN
MLSLQRFEAAVPAVVPYRAAAPRAVRWEVLHADLGVELPPDFRALAEAYPSLLVQDFLELETPEPGLESSFVADVRDLTVIVKDLSEAGLAKGYVPYPEPGGLLGWARSNCGDGFYWRTWSESPADWSVVVSGENDDWSEYAMGAVDFLAGIYRKDFKVGGMPENFPSDNPDVVALLTGTCQAYMRRR